MTLPPCGAALQTTSFSHQGGDLLCVELLNGLTRTRILGLPLVSCRQARHSAHHFSDFQSGSVDARMTGHKPWHQVVFNGVARAGCDALLPVSGAESSRNRTRPVTSHVRSDYFSRMQSRTTLSRPGNTCRLSDAPWTSTSSLTGSLRGANPTWSNHLCGVRMDCQSLSCSYGKKVTKRAKALGAANNPQRRPIILACGTTLPVRGYSFSRAVFRFPRHPNLVSGAIRAGALWPHSPQVVTCLGGCLRRHAYHSIWPSEMRSHPFPKVRVGAAYKEEGTRFARHSFQIVAPWSQMSIPTTALGLCLEGGIL